MSLHPVGVVGAHPDGTPSEGLILMWVVLLVAVGVFFVVRLAVALARR